MTRMNAASLAAFQALLLAMIFAGPAQAQGAPPTSFQVVAHDPATLEIRFHNMPLRSVHADASQNALALNFFKGVDGAAFDRLSAAMPEWISLAYANYDNGVIRASRPVTFLTRNENDGFSLRLVSNAPAPMVAAPSGPVALRGPLDSGPAPAMAAPPPAPAPPPPNLFVRYNAYDGLRGYDDLELAVNRDSYWRGAYARAAMQSNSEASLGSEYKSYHSGDRVIASHAHMKIALADGLSLVGSLDDTDVSATTVRQPNGSFAGNIQTNLFSFSAGLGLDLSPDSGVTLEALEGNHATGVRFTGHGGDPSRFWQLNAAWHQPLLETPEDLAFRAFTDHVELGGTWQLGGGLWASFAGHGDNYGVHGNASTGKTAGWTANLRWSEAFGPLLAGLSYDGHGDYLVEHVNATGAAPSPFIPLSLRNMETHAVTGSLSSRLWGDEFWIDLYGGWIVDRYGSDGGIYGGAIRYRPAPGVDIGLGARHSNVSTVQGELGSETRAGLTFTLGFDGLNYF